MSGARPRGVRPRAEAIALGGAALLVLLPFLAEPLGWWGGHVHQWLPPMSALWDPALGPGGVLAVVTAVAVVARGPALAASLPWRRLLGATWLAGAVWGLGLALVRGWAEGIRAPLAHEDEYLVDVPRVQGFGELLQVYSDRILLTAPDHWTTHNSGHPPLPLMAYTVLDRLGLGGSTASGLVTAAVGSTGVVAVLVALRALGDEERARRAAPFLALTPLVIWVVISADGAFMAVVAWGVALLALSATRPTLRGQVGLGLAAGLVLGIGVFLSYGLVLMGPIAVAVLLAARTWRPLLPAVLAALAVVAAFALGGFWWLEGQQTLVVRYYQGKGALRQYSYWIWGNLAVATITLGPAVVAGLGRALASGRRPRSGAAWLALGAGAAILAADLSGLSKSEVERIWLPFTAWLAPLAGWLARSPCGWLAAQAAWALAVAVLLRTTW